MGDCDLDVVAMRKWDEEGDIHPVKGELCMRCPTTYIREGVSVHAKSLFYATPMAAGKPSPNRRRTRVY